MAKVEGRVLLMQATLGIALIIILGLALLISLDARRRRQAAGMPGGAVLAQDTLPQDEAQPERALFSSRYRLVGRPDYLVQDGDYVVPVEVKTTRNLSQPRDGHALQLAAYCLLVEEEYGVAPPYGILRYPELRFKLPYGERERQWVIETLEAMREDESAAEVIPNHDQPGRCRHCQFLEICGMDLLRNDRDE
jgi:CRISPR-associated exonuclease Cas4